MSIDAIRSPETIPDTLDYPEGDTAGVLENPELEDNSRYLQDTDNSGQGEPAESLGGANDRTIEGPIDNEPVADPEANYVESSPSEIIDQPEAEDKVDDSSTTAKEITTEEPETNPQLTDEEPVSGNKPEPISDEVDDGGIESASDQDAEKAVVVEDEADHRPETNTAEFKTRTLVRTDDNNVDTEATVGVLQRNGGDITATENIELDGEPLEVDADVAKKLGTTISTSGELLVNGHISDCLTFGALLSGGKVVGTPCDKLDDNVDIEWVPGDETHPINSDFVPKPLQFISIGTDNLQGGVAFSHAVVRLPVEGNDNVYAHQTEYGQIVVSSLANAANLFGADRMQPMEQIKVTLGTGEVIVNYDANNETSDGSSKLAGAGSRDGEFGKISDLHLANIFDLDETTSGDLIDPSTGERYDNSTSTPQTELLNFGGYIVDAESNGSHDLLGSLQEEDDEAARWLIEHS